MVVETSGILDTLMGKKGVLGSAMISRDGGVLMADLPAGIHSETFAIMCATIIGAAHTINSDLGIGSPDNIVVDAQKGKFVISKAGKKELLAVVIDENYDLSEFQDAMEKAINAFNK